MLPTPLQKQVMTCENQSMTLEWWYEKATKFHSNWQKMQHIFGRKNDRQKNDSRKKKFSFPTKKEKDPNAMDVDYVHWWTLPTDEEGGMFQLQEDQASFKRLP